MIESFFWRKMLAKSGLGKYVPAVKKTLNGGEEYLSLLADRTLAAPLTELLDRALLPDINTPDSIHLALGSPRCEIYPSLPRTINDRRPSAWGDYELRAELADGFRRDHGVEHEPADEVFITHGATGAFAAVLDAFVNPGDRVVLFDPTSPVFSLGLKHRRASVAWVPTASEDGFVRFALNDLMRAMRGAKMIVLADPANPTGCVFASEDLEQIAFWAKKNDTLIVQDMSFDRWRNDPAKSRLANLPHTEGRIISIGSFAKSHGLSAARVGWLAGYRHLVRPCALAALMNAPFVAPLCQQVVTQALRMGEVAMNSTRDDLNDRREYVSERLRGMGLLPWAARAGFFFWTPVPTGETSRAFAQRLLTETGVLVNPGEVFGPSGSRFVRISFAVDEGRLREGMARLEGFVRAGSSNGGLESRLAAGEHAVQ
ncbi:pyridoxal phosphate-dependent aminotransferase [Zavarzinella formosa]|uniref:pyridoxal phosphate-dependent aminotransferase n=1 Tax=Zavarzinella formosa TaxID=360055 RepID=UPI0002E04C06|nr:pyridoxal phosphate-dependent aminotransferase [Zavarzinella formosa]